MRVVFLLFMFGLALSTCLTGCSIFTGRTSDPLVRSESDVEAQWRTAQEGVVALLSDGHVYCSGAWVDSVHVLTASHCLDGSTQYTVGLFEHYDPVANSFWMTFPMDVVRDKPEDDLALLRWAGSAIPPDHVAYPILDRDPYVGERIYPFGHGRGQGFFFTEGRVVTVRTTRFADEDVSTPFTMHSAYTIPGMSGGPVLNFAGELVCITSWRFDSEPVISGCVYVDRLRDILQPVPSQ